MNANHSAYATPMTAWGLACTAIAAFVLSLAASCGTPPRTAASAASTASELRRASTESPALPVEKTLPNSGIVLRLIPAGSFTVGSPTGEQDVVIESVPPEVREELRTLLQQETQHKVTLTNPFYLGKFEITQGQWKKVMGKNPSCFTNAGDNAPVENVSWHDCTNFMARLAVLEGMPDASFRLPTEAEWEYASRAGTQTAFCYGNDLDSTMANFNGNFPYGSGKKGEFRKSTVPVGQFKPNAWGLYDMHGNVWEWCADWHGDYQGDATNPAGPSTGTSRVTRGASWNIFAAYCRSANRFYRPPDESYSHGGFRLCMPAPQ